MLRPNCRTTPTAPQTEPFPDVMIPGIPMDDTNWCLSRVAKSLYKSKVEITSEGKSHMCDGRVARRSKVRYTINLRGETPESCNDERVLPDKSVLTSEGTIIVYEAEGLAHFTGDFEISSPERKGLFTGRMELSYRVGSHRVGNAEACDERTHVEGWLVGRAGERRPLSLRAMIAGKWAAPTPRAPVSHASDTYLTGVVVRPR
ncbi:MAG: hypothetical protein LC803_00415 [Acidobacteria bacterium]|nr:hypothetical protein [Acidobacteriota bacterium]